METLGLTSTEIRTAIDKVLQKSGLASEQLEDCRLYLEQIIRGNLKHSFHSFATSNVDEKQLDSLVRSVKNALVKVMNKRLEGGRKFISGSEQEVENESGNVNQARFYGVEADQSYGNLFDEVFAEAISNSQSVKSIGQSLNYLYEPKREKQEFRGSSTQLRDLISQQLFERHDDPEALSQIVQRFVEIQSILKESNITHEMMMAAYEMCNTTIDLGNAQIAEELREESK
ncbi:hypothetical protein Ddc_20983 [Ditylenchus destructor]|nr:hypothetical protein Ddc_20983 [Ditylenchus destructor]